MCVDRKVDTTAAASENQGDVQAIHFGVPRYNDLIWDVSLGSNGVFSSMQHGQKLAQNGKVHVGEEEGEKGEGKGVRSES